MYILIRSFHFQYHSYQVESHFASIMIFFHTPMFRDQIKNNMAQQNSRFCSTWFSVGNWSVSMTGGPYHWEFKISLGYPCQIKIHTRVPTTIICIVSYNSGFSKECLWVYGKFKFILIKSVFRLARVDPTVMSKTRWKLMSKMQ